MDSTVCSTWGIRRWLRIGSSGLDLRRPVWVAEVGDERVGLGGRGSSWWVEVGWKARKRGGGILDFNTLVWGNRKWFMVSTYFPHVRSEVMLLDMLTQACLAKGRCFIRTEMQQDIYVYCLKKSFIKSCCTSSVRCSQYCDYMLVFCWQVVHFQVQRDLSQVGLGRKVSVFITCRPMTSDVLQHPISPIFDIHEYRSVRFIFFKSTYGLRLRSRELDKEWHLVRWYYVQLSASECRSLWATQTDWKKIWNSIQKYNEKEKKMNHRQTPKLFNPLDLLERTVFSESRNKRERMTKRNSHPA